MLVPEAEQDWPLRSPPAAASHEKLLGHASRVVAPAAAFAVRLLAALPFPPLSSRAADPNF